MLPAAVTPFDYASLPADMADALRKQAEGIRGKVHSSTAIVIDIGRDLMAVKQHLEHGQFCAWVEAECGFSMRSAQRYILVAEFASDKNDTVSLLPPAAAYRLAAKSAPPTIVTEVMSRLSAGKVVTAEQVAAAFTQARLEKRETERRAKEAARRGKKSKRALQQEEQRRRAEERRRQQEEEKHRRVAVALVEELGEDVARRVDQVLGGSEGYLVAEHFHRELAERERVRVANEAQKAPARKPKLKVV